MSGYQGEKELNNNYLDDKFFKKLDKLKYQTTKVNLNKKFYELAKPGEESEYL